jgi:hypothetical protein
MVEAADFMVAARCTAVEDSTVVVEDFMEEAFAAAQFKVVVSEAEISMAETFTATMLS